MISRGIDGVLLWLFGGRRALSSTPYAGRIYTIKENLKATMDPILLIGGLSPEVETILEHFFWALRRSKKLAFRGTFDMRHTLFALDRASGLKL